MTDTWAAKVLEGVPRCDPFWNRLVMIAAKDGDYVEYADVLAAIARMAEGDGLIARLRSLDTWAETADVPDLAAARIAALTAQNREMALDVLASSGQAQEAYAAQLAAEAEAAALRAKVARLEGALIAEREENLWHCYYLGNERDGRWSDCCMSDAEWLVVQCGLDPDQPDYDATAVKAAIPVAARAALTDGGKDVIGDETA